MSVQNEALGLVELLRPEMICLDVQANDAAEVIALLGERLLQGGYVHPTYVAAVLDREAAMPTGLPLGGEVNAAIPHTDVEHVVQPAVAFATLATPVAFRNMIAPDETVPVRLVFLLAINAPKSQVVMLQQIAEVLQSSEAVAKLMAATSPAEVFALLSRPEAAASQALPSSSH